MKYTKKEVDCSRDNMKIYGELYMPASPVKDSIVITCHGLQSTHKWMNYINDKLAINGITCYTFDFIGGASKDSLSDGEYSNMTPLTEKEDLNCVIDKVKEWGYKNIYLLGHSQGAFECALCANERQNDIKGMYLLSPGFVLCDVKEPFGWGISNLFVEDCKKIKFDELCSNYNGLVRIYHSTTDEYVPYEYAEKANNYYKRSTLITYEGYDHNLNSLVFDDIIHDIMFDLER